MSSYSVEQLSRTLSFKDVSALRQSHDIAARSIWRGQYHLQPVSGSMGKPAGSCFYKGQWHQFYEWYPFAPAAGARHWYHAVSDDLVHWQNVGMAIEPDNWYDNAGCLGGTSFPEDDLVYFIYTGNNKDENGVVRSYQLLAGMNKDGKILKYEEPLIMPDAQHGSHQRGPKIFRRKEDDMYYILVGTQCSNGVGSILMYRSKAMHDGWKFLGELKIRGMEDEICEIEDPDIETINDKDVLFCNLRRRNQAQDKAVYFVGTLDLYHLEFIPEHGPLPLDYGFDFFGAKCADQQVYKDAVIVTGLLGDDVLSYPAVEEEGWTGMMALPREVSLQDGKLLQRPVMAVKNLKLDLLFEADQGRVVKDIMHAEMPRSCMMHIDDVHGESLCFNLFTWGRDRGFEIAYDKDKKTLTIDRSMMRSKHNAEYGLYRSIVLEDGLQSLDVYVDRSSVEIFVNDGAYVLSSRIFPSQHENMIRMAGKDIDVKVWSTSAALADDPVF